MVNDANLGAAATHLGCISTQAAPQLRQSLALAVHTHPGLLMHRQAYIAGLHQKREELAPTLNPLFERIHELETTLTPFFEETSKGKEDLEADALGQLSFQHRLTKGLNHIPWLLVAIAFFKIWAVPALTILFPILAWILPYLLLKFVYTLPISQDQYFSILKHLWSGSLGAPLEFDEAGIPIAPSFWSTKSFAQIGFFGFTMLQSMIQPIQNAMHLHTTDKIFCGVGASLVELQGLVVQLRKATEVERLDRLDTLSFLDGIATTDVRRSFIAIKEEPDRLRLLFREIARLEILWRIASQSWTPVRFKRDVLDLREAADISLQKTTAVPSSVELKLGEAPHSVITGPNGGGKSSFLRAVLQSVLFGHSYGYAPAAAATMPRFLWIACGLQLRDTPGTYSMFETEVKFAADALRQARSPAPGLLIYDELFHSTNPPDGARTAQLFLKGMWKTPHMFSIVSTHVFPLVEAAPAGVQAICCPAKAGPGGEIKYSYAVEPGICKVSSVHKVWERFGLVRQPTGSQNLSAKENAGSD